MGVVAVHLKTQKTGDMCENTTEDAAKSSPGTGSLLGGDATTFPR